MNDSDSSSGYSNALWIAEHRATSTDTQTISGTRLSDLYRSYSNYLFYIRLARAIDDLALTERGKWPS